MFNRKVAPGEKAYAETMSSSMISSNPTFNESILPTDNVVIFGDSLVNFNRKIKYNITRSLNNGRKKVKNFPGATSKDLLHYTDTTLRDNSFEVAVIHICLNYIVNNRSSLNTDHILQNIKNIAQMCKNYGISFMVKSQTSDIRVTYEYIRVTYG